MADIRRGVLSHGLGSYETLIAVASKRVSGVQMPRAGFATAGGLLVVGCALLVAACGSSSASPNTTSAPATTTATGGATTTTGTAGSAGFAAYRSCLQAHGVTFAAGGGGGFGGGFGGAGAGGAGAGAGAAAAGGADTTGTTTTGSGASGRFRGRPRTAAEQKAYTACASLRPTGGGAFGGGFGGGGGGFASSPAFAKFQSCLQSHGVQAGSAPDRTSTTYQSAFAACRSLLPAGGFGGGGFSGSGSTSGGAPGASFQKLQACLKAHGVQPGAAGSTPAKTAAALAACRSQLPNGGNSSPAGSSTTTTTG